MCSRYRLIRLVFLLRLLDVDCDRWVPLLDLQLNISALSIGLVQIVTLTLQELGTILFCFVDIDEEKHAQTKQAEEQGEPESVRRSAG